MECILGQIILTAGSSDGQDTIWMQMLVLVVVASLVGLRSIVKTRASKFKGREQYCPAGGHRPSTTVGWQNKAIKELKDKCLSLFFKKMQSSAVMKAAAFELGIHRTAGRETQRNEPNQEKNLAGGAELLKANFLLSTVEKTEDNDKTNVMMRKLSFKELARRNRLDAVDSKALKIYAINKNNLYGKDMQCDAMRQLAKRTGLR